MANIAIEAAEPAPPAPSAGERLSGRALEIAVCRAAGYRVVIDRAGGVVRWLDPAGAELDRVPLPPNDRDLEALAREYWTPHYLTDAAAEKALLLWAHKRWGTVTIYLYDGDRLDGPDTTCDVEIDAGRICHVVRSGDAVDDTGTALCRAVCAAFEAEARARRADDLIAAMAEQRHPMT